MSNLTVEVLASLATYDPLTGSLTWLPRQPSMFIGAEQDREHSCKIWNSKYAGKLAFTAINGNGYRHGAIFGKTVSAHKAAWALHHGEWPTHGIDHINGDRTDNRIANLRDVPISVNSKNQKRRSGNTSGITGVSYFARTKKWVAMIKGDGKVRNLGYFATIEDAAAARKVAEAKYGFHQNHGRAVA